MRPLRLGEEKKERMKKKETGQKYNGRPYWAAIISELWTLEI